MDDAMQILERMHADFRMVALESIQVVNNDSLTTSLQWRASGIDNQDDTVTADGSTPLEALAGLRELIYPSGSRSGSPE